MHVHVYINTLCTAHNIKELPLSSSGVGAGSENTPKQRQRELERRVWVSLTGFMGDIL